MATIRLIIIFLFASIAAFGQATEGDIDADIATNRTKSLTADRLYGVMQKLNYAKQSIKAVYTASGTNTYTVTAGLGIVNNDAGIQVTVKFTNANTSSTVTLNVNGIGAMALKTNLGANPDVGGIAAGSIYLIASTGTTWRIVGPTNEGGVLATEWGDIGGILSDQIDITDTLATKWRVLSKIKPLSSNYTAALGDQNNKVIILNGGADFKIPKDADVNFPIGSNLLAVDSLGTATFSKDPAVHIDTLEQAQVFTKIAADKWGVYKGGGSSDAVLTDGNGTTANGNSVDLGGVLTGDVFVDTNGHEFGISSTLGGGFFQSFINGTLSSSFSSNIAASDATSIWSSSYQSGGKTYFADSRSTADNTGGVVSSISSRETTDGDFSNEALVDNDGFRVITGTGIGLERLAISVPGKLTIDNTVTTTGTTGDRTINKMSGTVNFAAAGTSLTVANSLCTTSSIVFVVLRTNDATAVLGSCVPGSGSFVINMKTAPTAETSVGFWIIN